MFERLMALFERLSPVLDVLLLLWIVVQGQAVWYYERETFRMNRERFEERSKWREQKRQQLLKKEIGQKTNELGLNLALASPTATAEPQNKTTSVLSAAGNSKHTDPRTSTTITFTLMPLAILILAFWSYVVGRLRDLMNAIKWYASDVRTRKTEQLPM